MPETRVERTIFVLGLIATAALLAFIGLTLKNRHSHHASAATAATTAAAPATPAAAPAITDSATVTTAPPATTTTSAAVASPAHVVQGTILTLTATRGDSWLEVRAGSAKGRVLYAQTLTAGTTKRFRGRRLWVRFGAASNLDARLGRAPLHLPVGTYSALVTARGLGPLGP